MNISFGQTTDSSITKTNSKTINQKDNVDTVIVYVSFILETTGKLSNIKISKIKCRHCSKEFKENIKSEVLRVIESMTDFDPPKERTKFTQPIILTFTD